jgi:hypothetical protein
MADDDYKVRQAHKTGQPVNGSLDTSGASSASKGHKGGGGAGARGNGGGASAGDAVNAATGIMNNIMRKIGNN